MYSVLQNLFATLTKWEKAKKISEHDVLEFMSHVPLYTVKPIDMKQMCKMVSTYGGSSTNITDERFGYATFYHDGKGFDGACQFAKALHSLGYDTNIIHEQGAHRTSVEWR